MINFYTDVVQKNSQFHTTNRVSDLSLLEPVTRAAVENIMLHSEQMGIKLLATETFRSSERQLMLYNQHATELKNVGVHHFGLAVDFCKIIDGKASWDGDWSFLGKISKLYGMVWGGDWNEVNPGSFRDWDHVQRVNVSDQDKLFDGSWYPDDSYTPRLIGWPPGNPQPSATFSTASGTTFQVGMSGAMVKRIQTGLVLNGAHISEDGMYGPKTAAAVANFQNAHRLFATGRCDPQTLKLLGL